MSIGLKILLVGLGGFGGAISRFSLSKLLNKHAFMPLGTLIVNLLGSLLLGMIIGANSNAMIGLLFGTGFLGAFTTFSTLNLEIVSFSWDQHRYTAMIYIFLTYMMGLLLALLGYELGDCFFQ